MWIIAMESSGLDPRSYPIDVAITNGTYEYTSLIQPVEAWHYWSQEAEDVHHISRAHLMNKGTQAIEVAKQLNNILHTRIAYTDAITWNSLWSLILHAQTSTHRLYEVRSTRLLFETHAMYLEYIDVWKEIAHVETSEPRTAINQARITFKSLTAVLGKHEMYSDMQ